MASPVLVSVPAARQVERPRLKAKGEGQAQSSEVLAEQSPGVLRAES
jgi:hypothetical protein